MSLAPIGLFDSGVGGLSVYRELRRQLPHEHPIGPARPAAEPPRPRVIGVLATPATFQGQLFASVVDRFAQGVRVITQTCPGLVDEIEQGHLDGPRVTRILETALAPLREAGIDRLGLACPHSPLV